MHRTLYDLGDAVEGKRIVVECRKYSGWRLISRSGQHRGNRTVVYDARCTIEQAYEYVSG